MRRSPRRRATPSITGSSCRCCAAAGSLCLGSVWSGPGGAIRLKREMALEQRMRLEAEGVRFRGRRVLIEEHRRLFVP